MSPAPSLLYTPSPSGLSTTSRVALAVVVLAVCGGIYYWYVGVRAPAITPIATNPTPNAPVGDTLPVVGAGVSGATILTEAAAIDAQLSGLTADNASMNAPDQPISQSY